MLFQKSPLGSLVSFYLFTYFVILFLTEREREQAGEGQRETGRHRIQSSRLQALSCQHRAWCRTLNSQTVRSWPEPRSDAWPTQPPRHPGSLVSEVSSIHRCGLLYDTIRYLLTQVPSPPLHLLSKSISDKVFNSYVTNCPLVIGENVSNIWINLNCCHVDNILIYFSSTRYL